MAKRDFGMVASNSLEVKESPLTILPGMEPIISITVGGSGTISSPTMKLYKGTKDVTSTNTTGSMSVSGRRITLKQLTSLTPGDYAAFVYFDDGGQESGRFLRFSVPKEQA